MENSAGWEFSRSLSSLPISFSHWCLWIVLGPLTSHLSPWMSCSFATEFTALLISTSCSSSEQKGTSYFVELYKIQLLHIWEFSVKMSSLFHVFMSTDLTFICHLGKIVTFMLTMRTWYCSYIFFLWKTFFLPQKDQDFIAWTFRPTHCHTKKLSGLTNK